METILKVRRLFHKNDLSQRTIARQLRLSRVTVKKYLNAEAPPQRLSAKRHFEYLCSVGFEGKYPYVSRFVKQFKTDFTPTQQAFVPQRFQPGDAYQFGRSIEKVVIAGSQPACLLRDSVSSAGR